MSRDACQEPARCTPVTADADVVVCGGGPAGVGAAIRAARHGAKTLLIETHGCLGGIWTSGLLGWILDHENKPGLIREIRESLRRHGGQGPVHNAYDPEIMKFVLEELCAGAGVDIRLHTRVCAALLGQGRRLTHVITESKSGREAVAGRVFIDCTGDGDLGALAGCGFDFGHPKTGRTQPMSLLALVGGVVPSEIADFYPEADSDNWEDFKDRLRCEIERSGHSPSYAKPTLFRLCGDLFVLMANHEYGVSGIDAGDVTKATLRARAELHRIVSGLRSLGGPWKNLRIVATGAQIGVREGRRLHGRYTVSSNDLRDGRRHEDAICTVNYGVDIHATDPGSGKGVEAAALTAKAYDIPLRALIAKDVDGLLMAGRCISGDFIAHSSYRVTGNAVAMGEAAGVTAALAARRGELPGRVGRRDVQETIETMPTPERAIFVSGSVADDPLPSSVPLAHFCKRLREKASAQASCGPVVIVAFGDSVTMGSTANGEFVPDEVYHSRLRRMLAERFPGPATATLSVINSGIGGDTATRALDRIDRDVLRHEPDLVLVAFGANDLSADPTAAAQFEASVRRIITTIRERTLADIVLLTPTYMASRENGVATDKGHLRALIEFQRGGIVAKYAELIRAIGRDEGIPVADVYARWEALEAAGVDTTARLANGLNHPVPAMHEIPAQEICDLIVSAINATEPSMPVESV